MSTPFPLEEAAQQDTRGSVGFDPNQPHPSFGSGWGLNEDLADPNQAAYARTLNRVVPQAGIVAKGIAMTGEFATYGEELLAGGLHAAGRAYNAVGTPKIVGSELPDIARKLDDDAKARMDALAPDPRTAGAALQTINAFVPKALVYTAGTAAGGPQVGAAALGAVSGYETFRERRAQGVDETTAAELAGLSAAANYVGGVMPLSFGTTLATHLATGVLANEALGIASNVGDAALLRAHGYTDMADQQEVLDKGQIVVNALLGAAAGIGGHAHWAALHQDPALAANLALQNRKSGPGVPVTPEDVAAQAAAHLKALNDLDSGEHVNVAGTGIEESSILTRGGEVDPALHEILHQTLEASGLLEEHAKAQALEEVLGRKIRGEPEPAAPTGPQYAEALHPLDMKDFGLPAPPEPLPVYHELLRPHWDEVDPTHQDMSPEREAMRARLIAQRFAGAEPVPAHQKPVALFLGGGGASGKGTVLKRLEALGALVKGAVHLDPDEFKTGNPKKGLEGIPQYQHVKEAGDSRAAKVTHEESSLLYRRALEKAIAGRHHVILDRTMGNGAKAMKELQKLRDAGYEIRLVGVSVDPEEAIQRAVKRAQGPEKRYVPLTDLLKAHKGFSQSWRDYAAFADQAELFDNNVPKDAVPVTIALQKRGGQMEIVDPERYTSFERKASLNEQANTVRQISEAPAERIQQEARPGERADSQRAGDTGRAGGLGSSAEGAGTGRTGELNTGGVSGSRLETVSTASGRKIEVRPRIAEAADLITSDRPEFPQELQPRQRGERAALDAQVRDIAANLEPERLGSSPEADRGAPIVSAKNEVESGNGRVMALRRVYEEETGKVAAPTRTKAELTSEFIGRDDAFWRIKQETDETPSEFEDSGYSGTQCTGYACAILQKLGSERVKVYGFSGEENPTSSIAQDAGGHDFAVVDGKYIVDPWLPEFGPGNEPGVFDLKKDAGKVTELYGDRGKWKDMTSQMPKAPATKAQAYREFLQSQGHDISGFKQPVLVRERVTPMNQSERQAFAVEANQSATAAMSPVERGAADARRLDAGMLERLADGEITSLGNRSFVKGFLEGLPVAERSALLNPDGSLSQEGVRRIQAAVLTKAYGGEPRSNALLGRMLESTDAEQRNILGALMDAAPAFARLRQMVTDGILGPQFDITPKVLRAVEEAQALRESGLPLKEFLAQTDMLNPRDPVVDQILQTFYDKAGKRAAARGKVKSALMDYVDRATAQRLDQGNLFGDEPLAPDALLGAALEGREDEVAPASGDLFAKKPAEAPAPALGIADQALEEKPNLEIAMEEGTVRAAGAKLAADLAAERTEALAPKLFKSATDCFLRGAA